jgi:ubiquinone/menaquinone biosynthesis C-methylase UbiE
MAAEVSATTEASPNGAPASAPSVAAGGPLEELMRAAAGLKERPKAWSDVGSYPWSDDEFSKRYVRRANYQDLYGMKETGEEVDELITLLNIKPKMRVLDLCSGNGRHSIALALRGCKMTGVDIGPGPIALAKETSRNLGLNVDYRQVDALTVSFEDAYDAIILTCGGLSDFSPSQGKDIFSRAERALVAGGSFMAEFLEEPAPAPSDARTWRYVASDASLFADAAHLQLDERLYDKDERAEVTRSYIVTADGKMRQVARCRQYYREDDVKGLLAAGSLQLIGFSAGSSPGYKRVLAKKR